MTEKEIKYIAVNSLGATLYKFNCYPLEVVSRYRDPQLQVGEQLITPVEIESTHVAIQLTFLPMRTDKKA